MTDNTLNPPTSASVTGALEPADAGTSLIPVSSDPAAGPGGTPSNPDKGNSLWSDAWGEMRHKPMFWFSVALIAVLLAIALVPQMFTRTDPYLCNLNIARQAPSGQHWFGTDVQGCDIYARTIHGARSSILVGLLTTLGTTLLGGLIGIIAGYAGGWVDTLLSRIGEVFFAIPLLLGGIVILYSFPSTSETPYLVVVAKVVAALVLLGWPSLARLMRSSVLQVKPNEYVQAARALGASPWRIISRHILPNAMAAVLVVATINLGSYIAIEATLSFLGIGLKAPTISWGIAISEASGLGYISSAPWMLAFPSLFLSLTVLAFIMLGEVIRDALDPKLR
ncbi:ABC transporter permease [Luteococcus peritonei]|uniref:ABC transporter permease n=1 Tax=Luteococcus peritonei TaxID=88874 RepID=A0ABW4RRY7_9ACTN